MMTPAELFREYTRPDGKPDRMLKQYEALGLLRGDPVNRYIRPDMAPGRDYVDKWGVHQSWPAGAPGPTPHITPETKVIKDITHWRDYVTVPDLAANCTEGWEPLRERAAEVRAEGKLSAFIMGTGMFEQTHFLMGFEDALANFLEHPQEMHELVDAIAEYRMTFLRLLVENVHPDVIISHDDWGTKSSLFMQPDTWREFYKENYRRFYGYMRQNGVIAIHHADSYLVPIIEDMVEIGIQGWQGTLPENNIPALQKQLNGRMFLMGGIGAVIDRADSTPEEIRSYVQQVLEDNCPGGGYIPCITYGGPGTVFPHVDPVIDATIDAYNAVAHLPGGRRIQPKRVKAEQQAVVQKVEEEVAEEKSIFEKLAIAQQKGQRKKVLSLCQEALDNGIAAQDILNRGLMVGMNRLGDDFSANRAFVPEMLMAARCMDAATSMLKPYLVSESSEAAGRAVLGTIKGDLHDIGKNLVRLMLEGAGIEVIDLGCDVEPEDFVNTAVEKNCNIIACSSLLTTSMPRMKDVVRLAKERGIRDQVTIMVGGAPTSQSFCDEIGADVYTSDAAAAARAAVQAVAAKRAG